MYLWTYPISIGINPIRPAPVPQRHYHHKIVCQIYMNGLNGLSFHDFSSWILLCPLKKSNLQYLYKIFWKIKFWTYLVSLNFESKMEEFVKKLTYWVRMLTFLHVALNLFMIDTNKLRFVNFDPKNARGGLATDLKALL